MSALAEALVAAQRRAISAMEKAYVAARAAPTRPRIPTTLFEPDPRDDFEKAREAFSEGRSIV